jgi:quercetin dioxygenase-like cupin family protein
MNRDTQFVEQCEDCALDAALYSLGALPEEKAGAVELRLRSGCPFCSAQVAHYAAVAEHLSLSVTPVEPPPELRRRLLDRIKTQDAFDSTEHRKVVRGQDVPWVKMPIPGVEFRPLVGDKTFLLRMQPGAVFPKHDHPQAEQCYILEGSITDSDGLTLHAGDFVVMSRDIQHDPIRSAAGCTLLVVYAD